MNITVLTEVSLIEDDHGEYSLHTKKQDLDIPKSWIVNPPESKDCDYELPTTCCGGFFSSDVPVAEPVEEVKPVEKDLSELILKVLDRLDLAEGELTLRVDAYGFELKYEPVTEGAEA